MSQHPTYLSAVMRSASDEVADVALAARSSELPLLSADSGVLDLPNPTILYVSFWHRCPLETSA